MRKLLYIALLMMTSLNLLAQEQQEDSLVVLMSSKSAQMVDIEGASYRKVVGPARFLHNNTYLLCDTAFWNVDGRYIEAWGNVSILQNETVLTSDRLTYFIDQDLAQFRGSLVQLQDKDHNVLRTDNLDYNTKDSVAIFRRGGSMRDKDGQIIESDSGTYDSKIKKFTFENKVNMFTDSIFVKTTSLVYESELNLATFGHYTDAWQDDNMLSANAGWYDRGIELFCFTRNVHVMSDEQEGWCDSLYFNRTTKNVEMLGSAQVSDTTRNVYALAGYIHYLDSLSKVTLTREPAVISQTEEEDGSIDTVYLGAERLVYYTVNDCDVDSLELVKSKDRLAALEIDPVGEYRKKAAEAAAKAAEEEAMKDPNYKAKVEAEQRKAEEEKKEAEVAENAPAEIQTAAPSLNPADTLAVTDSLAVADSLSVPAVDTVKIGFLEAIRNVRIFKKSVQVVCDSLLYTDLDSLARLYINPVVWQDTVRQYAADSISIVVSGGAMEKASLMSNAFITIQEDKHLFDQIRGAEMTAFFEDNGILSRFDALGGASALFFIEENGALATVNKTDSKMLSATFKDGNLQRIYYYDAPKNDGFPVVQLSEDERKMKGFNWCPERRPVDPQSVTKLTLRPSERIRYSASERPRFVQTDKYFPGYISDIHRQIAVRDSLRRVRELEKDMPSDTLRVLPDSLSLGADSLSVASDSLSMIDSLAVADSLAIKDSLAASIPAVKDSIAVADTSVAAAVADTVSAVDPKEARKAEKQALKLKKQAEREARWAEMDRRDEEKAKAKEEKRKEKERKRKRKALKEIADKAEKDARTLEKYRLKYEKKKAREDEKAARKAASKSARRKER